MVSLQFTETELNFQLIIHLIVDTFYKFVSLYVPFNEMTNRLVQLSGQNQLQLSDQIRELNVIKNFKH